MTTAQLHTSRVSENNKRKEKLIKETQADEESKVNRLN